jgi:hypothetical protein
MPRCSCSMQMFVRPPLLWLLLPLLLLLLLLLLYPESITCYTRLAPHCSRLPTPVQPHCSPIAAPGA